ncbi:YciI family protein [Nocardia sp. CDC153]|uniref:YciI family protein n=1 Tax=Nocardia sp. CDC153 TaxID=3112167 RepID=UPI002DB69D71|nr:YciI family protein [Nocardia sp. CDC153]MEC3954893.1 YciI family protein [Nocardia sp. CDC153]
MYALVIVRYRLPLEEVDEALREAHREYLRGLKKQGLLIASGPFQPHFGGGFLLRVPDVETLDRIRDHDPFTEFKIGQYEILVWDVKTGVEDLDRIA